jgi:hypothetical protein
MSLTKPSRRAVRANDALTRAGKLACETILARVEEGLSIPEADLARIKENLAYSVNKLK